MARPLSGLALGRTAPSTSSTGSGDSDIRELDRRARRQDVEAEGLAAARSRPFISTPVVFSEGDKTYVAATSGSTACTCWMPRSLGGADHRTRCLRRRMRPNVRFSSDGIATWRDASRHALDSRGSQRRDRRVQGGRQRRRADARSARGRSRNMPSPRTPIIVNGVVFALAGGNSGANAVLYALDPATGKELWNSGTHDHVDCQRRLVCRHRSGVRGDGRQHGVCVRHSVGDQLTMTRTCVARAFVCRAHRHARSRRSRRTRCRRARARSRCCACAARVTRPRKPRR